MRYLFIVGKDPANGIITLACAANSVETTIATCGDGKYHLPGIIAVYDPIFARGVLLLVKAMGNTKVNPVAYIWKEKERIEIVIFFVLTNPPERVWREILGTVKTNWSRCAKIYSSCETDLDPVPLKPFLKLLEEKKTMVVTVSDGFTTFAEFIIPVTLMRPPNLPPAPP